MDIYEVRLRKDHRGVDLISDALPFVPTVVTAGRVRSTMQSGTRSTTAAHIPWSFVLTVPLTA
jgi:hypothetical protein